MQYATFVQAEQSKKIETLEASQKSLQSQLVAKDKMIAQLKKVEASNATMAMQVIALEKQIQSLKAELTLSKEEIQGYKLEREDFISARSVLVLEDTNKSILIQKLQDDLEKANHGLKQVVSQMVSGKEEAGPSSTALQQQLTSLQKENESLRQENQQLREQNEQQEHSLSQLLLATPQEAPATQSARIANASGNTNRGINFPERSSSAIGLIDLIPEDGASLELQMLRQRALTKRDSEIERLRKENEDLVQQLVATLESLNRL
ncbi:hypothetical protein BCR33DRAFT_715993 [Rhizoclosmatium globosum]|uniref:Uncharacterized protein n=1 Tax=Rhizoclosmatium globosum TaxID=329046 RepID=A0A1Y2CGN5_9FUNG|nr:hypothetical protein BCR33DRAFT_715993 [Rhizoclosmatium globosum]|eukprot:ORY45984.1 hypothetical protein BCR33DRAFT_715993 [Rhizoclosmatium globosum]